MHLSIEYLGFRQVLILKVEIMAQIGVFYVDSVLSCLRYLKVLEENLKETIANEFVGL